MEEYFKKGIVTGQTAYQIYNTLSKVEEHFNDQDFHIQLDSVIFGYLSLYNKIKRITNCKLKTSFKNINLYIYKNVSEIDLESIPANIMVDSNLFSINLENIISVTINVLLEPLFKLRKCQSVEEAVYNWALNKIYLENPPYIDYKKLKELNMVRINPEYLNDQFNWLLTRPNIYNFIPKKYKTKLLNLQKMKKNLWVEFMETIVSINKYFIKKVSTYHKSTRINELTYFFLDFNIEFYGLKEEVLDKNIFRKQLLLYNLSKVKNSHDNNHYLHLKSFAILNNLRWFFNTRNNNKKAFGFDGEYGLTKDGEYGQTYHKYDDVILWLTTHPNNIEDVEFIILDSIPLNYIFNF